MVDSPAILGKAFKPLGDRVLVRKLIEEPISRGGIFMPADVNTRGCVQAKVLAVGPGRFNVKTGGTVRTSSVKIGDTVLLPDFTGYRFKDEVRDHEEFALVREDELLGLI